MDLQTGRRAITSLMTLLVGGCTSNSVPRRPAYALVGQGERGSPVRMFRSEHHLLYTTLLEDKRIDAIIATLEVSFDACVELTGFKPGKGATAEEVFIFDTRAEWEAFTRRRAGALAPTYLQLDRGGYTLGKACVVRDQGERDTLTVLAHEELHLFIATHFLARPPPFVEEGLATLLENVHSGDGVAHIELSKSTNRAGRIAALSESGRLLSLRSLLSMHAGNVVGLGGAEVDSFYAQAWAFARFLREGDAGKYRPALMKMLDDARTGALSSASLADDPAMVERYLGAQLEAVEAAYRKFVAKIE